MTNPETGEPIQISDLEKSKRKYKSKILSILLHISKRENINIPIGTQRDALFEAIFDYLVNEEGEKVIVLYQSKQEDLIGLYGSKTVDKSFYLSTARDEKITLLIKKFIKENPQWNI